MQPARLLFDSSRTSGLAGLRALVSEERSLLYQAHGLTVDLVVFPASGGLEVVYGQVIDMHTERSVEGAQVHFEASGEATCTDAFGQFSLSSVTPVAGQRICVDAGERAFACQVPANAEVVR